MEGVHYVWIVGRKNVSNINALILGNEKTLTVADTRY
jgi:hypothetical protein